MYQEGASFDKKPASFFVEMNNVRKTGVYFSKKDAILVYNLVHTDTAENVCTMNVETNIVSITAGFGNQTAGDTTIFSNVLVGAY